MKKTKKENNEQGEWLGWNDFLGIKDQLKDKPIEYLKSMLNEFGRSKSLQENPAYVEKCRDDVIEVLNKPIFENKRESRTIADKINKRLFSKECKEFGKDIIIPIYYNDSDKFKLVDVREI